MTPGISAPRPPLEGGHNFRDLGGYPTADMRMVRRGLVFRSGDMSRFTSRDTAEMRRLAIRTVCDLRSTPEREQHPAAWVDAQTYVWARDTAHSGADILARARTGDLSAVAMFNHMRQAYRDLLNEQRDAYREIFETLAERKTPLIFNCAVGKDRTGVAAALLLTMLGVPREFVFADYLLSNEILRRELPPLLEDERSQYSVLKGIPSDVLAPLLSANSDYLTAMFSEADARYGGVNGYLISLGVGENAIRSLRNHLITTA
jgi:protein-tyrosine phosphatase